MNIRAKKILSKYLFYMLRLEFLSGNFMGESTQTTNIANINTKTLGNYCFPLPPLAEQERIVDQIESIFAKLDEAKEKMQSVRNTFVLRESAIMHKAYSGELTSKWRADNNVSKDGWKRKKFSELCNIVRGGSPRPAGSPEFYDGDIPFMKVADITGNNGIYVSTTEHTIKEAGLRRTRMIEANTLLLTNSGATLGVPAITTIQTTINDGIAAFLNLNNESLLFFYYFWKSKTAELRAINKGAAQPNLNTTIIGDVEVDVPSITEQQEIVKILQNVMEREEYAKELCENLIEQVDLVKKSVLAKAFRGELGTNNPDEESAVELLQSIVAAE